MHSRYKLGLLFIAVVLAFFGCGNDGNNQFFLSNAESRVIVCDTIFTNEVRDGYLAIQLYETIGAKDKLHDGKAYVEYGLSANQERQPDLIRLENNKVFLLSKNAPKESNFAAQQLLFDFDSKVGDSWSVGYSGILSGLLFTVDSVVNENDDLDILLHISAKPIYDISDRTLVDKLVLSKKDGLKSITIIGPTGRKLDCDCS